MEHGEDNDSRNQPNNEIDTHDHNEATLHHDKNGRLALRDIDPRGNTPDDKHDRVQRMDDVDEDELAVNII